MTDKLPLETTPKEITDSILTFCAGLSDQSPVFVPVSAIEGATTGYCLENVKDQIATNGGEMVLGWCVWERPTINFTAEFHAVWKTPAGELLDITAKPDSETKVLFVPDPTLTWNGVRIPSHTHPLRHWQEITDFLAANSRYKNLFVVAGDNSIDATDYHSAGVAINETRKRLVKRYLRNIGK